MQGRAERDSALQSPRTQACFESWRCRGVAGASNPAPQANSRMCCLMALESRSLGLRCQLWGSSLRLPAPLPLGM